MSKGDMVTIPVAAIQFVEGGNTMWIHGPQGATVLRIKTKGQFTSKSCAQAFPHGDAVISESIEICVPQKEAKMP